MNATIISWAFFLVSITSCRGTNQPTSVHSTHPAHKSILVGLRAEALLAQSLSLADQLNHGYRFSRND